MCERLEKQRGTAQPNGQTYKIRLEIHIFRLGADIDEGVFGFSLFMAALTSNPTILLNCVSAENKDRFRFHLASRKLIRVGEQYDDFVWFNV